MTLNSLRKPFKYSYNSVSLIIIGLNIAVFLLTTSFPKLKYFLSLNVLYVTQANAYWQFFTYMFVHGDFSHILFNMLGILFFGVAVERALGSKEFTLLYFTSGILCGVISFLVYLLTGANLIFLMGASGAIYALLLAYAVIFPKATIYIWGILPIPAPLLIAIYAGIELSSQLLSLRDGIAHMTHLAGFAVAWLYFIIRMGINPWRIWKAAYSKK